MSGMFLYLYTVYMSSLVLFVIYNIVLVHSGFKQYLKSWGRYLYLKGHLVDVETSFYYETKSEWGKEYGMIREVKKKY